MADEKLGIAMTEFVNLDQSFRTMAFIVSLSQSFDKHDTTHRQDSAYFSAAAAGGAAAFLACWMAMVFI